MSDGEYVGYPEHQPVRIGYAVGGYCEIECSCGEITEGATWPETARNLDSHLLLAEDERA